MLRLWLNSEILRPAESLTCCLSVMNSHEIILHAFPPAPLWKVYYYISLGNLYCFWRRTPSSNYITPCWLWILTDPSAPTFTHQPLHSACTNMLLSYAVLHMSSCKCEMTDLAKGMTHRRLTVIGFPLWINLSWTLGISSFKSANESHGIGR